MVCRRKFSSLGSFVVVSLLGRQTANRGCGFPWFESCIVSAKRCIGKATSNRCQQLQRDRKEKPRQPRSRGGQGSQVPARRRRWRYRQPFQLYTLPIHLCPVSHIRAPYLHRLYVAAEAGSYMAVLPGFLPVATTSLSRRGFKVCKGIRSQAPRTEVLQLDRPAAPSCCSEGIEG